MIVANVANSGNDEFVKIAFAEVDGEKIKEDTWYKLDDNGEFMEVEE